MPLGRGPVPGTSRTALCGTKTQSDRALWYKTVSFFAVHFPGGEEGGHGPSLLLSQMWKRFSTGGCTVQSVLVVVQCVLVLAVLNAAAESQPLFPVGCPE